MTDVDDFLDGYQVPVEEVPICRDPSLVERFALVESRLAAEEARAGLAGAPPELLELHEALSAEVEEQVQVFRLQAIPLPGWVRLMAEHPPTPAEREAGEFANPDTWEPAVVAACAVDPVMSVEQASRMRSKLAAPEWGALRDAVIRLHTGGAGPKSLLLSALRRASAASSDSLPSTESLADPSSDASAEQ